MNKTCTLLLILTFTALSGCSKNLQQDNSACITELDDYWAEVSRCVNEGDFNGYKATFHKDAVFVSGLSKKAYPISDALKRWKQDFTDTKSGKTKASVQFRFSRRLGDKTTAHETGMFYYTSVNTDGTKKRYYINLEVLLIKHGTWKIMMEYQKSKGTEKEWNKLKLDDGLARTPPMGWYPWNQFGEEPQNEQLIKETADALVSSGMHEVGYSLVGPDEGICFYRDSNNMLATNRKRYPSGLRGLGDYIHKKGLKYALYTDAGTLTCSKAMPGTKGYEFEDMIQFAKWRCDYVKIDWCNTQGQDIIKTYTKLHDAQHAAGRPIVHSLCSWGVGEPWKWAASVGHLWRTTGDICGPGHADWKKAMKIVSKNERLYKSAGPGHWNDPDMMVVGMDGLSESQNRSFFSLWCIMASPLIAGNDLRNMSASTIEILTNMEAIGINQDPLGIQGHIVRRDGDVSIWAGKPLYDRSQAVLALNQQSSPRDVRIEWSDIGIDKEAGLYVRDLWTHKTSGPHTNDVSVPVAANDVVMLRISKANDFSLPPIIVADSYLVSLRAADTVAQSLSATITISNKGSDDLPLWKVQKGLPSWLTVTVSKDGKNQTLTNTISTSGLKKGLYHAIVRADNTEPVSGKPMSAVYYDVDLEVPNDVATQSKTAIKLE